MAGFIECDSLTFTDGSVVTPGGEHLGHPLTRDALGSLKHMVSITGELNRRPDAAAFRPKQTQESMKEFSHACPRIDQTVSEQMSQEEYNQIFHSYGNNPSDREIYLQWGWKEIRHHFDSIAL